MQQVLWRAATRSRGAVGISPVQTRTVEKDPPKIGEDT